MKIVTGPSGGNRVQLAKVLPLAAPLVVQFFPVYACNFRCRYCFLSIPREKRPFISDTPRMEFNLFKKCVDDIKAFPAKPRVLRFVGLGEPLLHGDIIEMVRYAASRECAERVEILTNGVLLEAFMSDQLIRAGLNRLVVSVQGTSAAKYREVCGRDVDFDGLLSRLAYTYQRRGAMHIHIKAIDCALDGPEDVQRFYDLFGPLCDTIAVENAGPIYPGVAYNGAMPLRGETQYGVPSTPVRVCPQGFASLQVNPDGKVVPCYSADYPCIVGDANAESLLEIWEGEKLRVFRRRMLLYGRGHASRACAECRIIDHRMSPEDSLDGDVERLRRMFG